MQRLKDLPNCAFWTEKKFQLNFTNWLKNKGILYYKTHGGQIKNGPISYIAKSGWSDLIVICENEIFFIELKKRLGKLRESQLEWIKQSFKANKNLNILIFYADQYDNFKNEFKKNGKIFSLAIKSSAINAFDFIKTEKEDK